MPTFHQIWNQHPNVTGEAPLLDRGQYPNQCAVNLYAALQRSGVDLRTFHGQLSWQTGKPKYAIRAQDLANWLATHGMLPGTKIQKFKGDEVFEKIKGNTGVIFFQNYWGPGNQGDHIDLWNGSRLTDILSWMRIYARIGSVGLGTDYRKAESAWFWALL